MNIYKTLIILLLLTTACKVDQPKNKIPETGEETPRFYKLSRAQLLDPSEGEEPKTDEPNDSLIMVDYLVKFDMQKDYYLPLFLTAEITPAEWDAIKEGIIKLVYQDEPERRFEMQEEVVKKYFSTTGMDRLFLLNKDQEVLDTIVRNRFEYYEATFESFYVATYRLNQAYGDSVIAVSANRRTDLNTSRSPKIVPTETYTLEEIRERFGAYDSKFSEFSLLHGNDTLTLVSAGNYANDQFDVFLLWNNQVKDSLSSDSLTLLDLNPIPFSTQEELTYIYTAMKPDTDWVWTGLLGIDTANQKFIWHETNRIKR